MIDPPALGPWYNRAAGKIMAEAARPIESHDVHSERLMRHAYEQLEKGDRLQASEKAWGAVAHRLKVVADAHGIPYNTHRDIYPLERELVRYADDPERLRLLFSNADSLHRNYYIDSMDLQTLRTRLDDAQTLLDMLDGPQYSGGNGVVAPSPKDPPPEPVEVVPLEERATVLDVVIEDKPVASISVAAPDDRSARQPRLLTPSKKRRRQRGGAYLRRRERNRKRGR